MLVVGGLTNGHIGSMIQPLELTKNQRRKKRRKEGRITSEHLKVILKGFTSVYLSDPPCKDGNARFTTVPLKLQSNQKCERYCYFSVSKGC